MSYIDAAGVAVIVLRVSAAGQIVMIVHPQWQVLYALRSVQEHTVTLRWCLLSCDGEMTYTNELTTSMGALETPSLGRTRSGALIDASGGPLEWSL